MEEIEGMKVIHSPYGRVWLVARTVVNSKADTANAVAIQAEEKLVPLKNWKREGVKLRSRRSPTKEVTNQSNTRFRARRQAKNRSSYWNALGAALKQFKPPAADAPELELLEERRHRPRQIPGEQPNARCRARSQDSAPP